MPPKLEPSNYPEYKSDEYVFNLDQNATAVDSALNIINPNKNETMAEEEFLRIFAFPLLTVLVSLFILALCLLFILRKIRNIWDSGEDSIEEQDPRGEIDIVMALRQVQNVE